MLPRALFPLVTMLVGCFPPGEGVEVPLDDVYFPTGLTLDTDASYLFVVNSDFDLQYNAGSVQTWNLATLRQAVYDHGFGTYCADWGERQPQDKLLYPGRCGPM